MNSGELISSLLIDLQRLFKNEVTFKDISYSQILALISISDGGVEMSTLSWDLALDNSTVTRLVNRLEKKNLVVRVPDQLDHRIKRVVLSNKGKKLFSEVIPVMELTRDQLRKGITEKEVELLRSVLSKIYKNLITN